MTSLPGSGVEPSRSSSRLCAGLSGVLTRRVLPVVVHAGGQPMLGPAGATHAGTSRWVGRKCSGDVGVDPPRDAGRAGERDQTEVGQDEPGITQKAPRPFEPGPTGAPVAGEAHAG